MISKFILTGISTGAMRDIKPNIQKMLKIFEPTIFPTTKSKSFFMTALTEVTSSGREVPNAITVAPIRKSLTPKLPAI